MGIEIERKFLVDHSKWADLIKPPGVYYKQGYILKDISKTIRVRVAGGKGYLTIKGKTTGISRSEFEYEIPVADAEDLLLKYAEGLIVKTRYRLVHEEKLWEVDVFSGDNEGLIVAEIELKTETEWFDIPEWIGEEVTADDRYYNSNLLSNPFKLWSSV